MSKIPKNFVISDYLKDKDVGKHNYGVCKSCNKQVAWSRDKVISHKVAKAKNCTGITDSEQDLFRQLKVKNTVEVHTITPIEVSESSKSSKSAEEPQNALTKTVDRLTLAEKKRCDDAVANYFHQTSIALSIADSEAFKNLIRVLRPAYAEHCPSSKVIGGTMLDEAYNKLYKDNIDKLKRAKCYHLVTDGWSNIRNEHILNFIACVPRKPPVFIKAVATGKAKVSGQFHYDETMKVAEEISVDNLVSVISDNCNQMQAVYKILEAKHPTKFGQGCASHALNLFLKDIESLIGDTTSKAIAVIKFINGHHRIKASFDQIRASHSNVCSLELPVATRWGAFVDSTKRLYQARHVISEVSDKNEFQIPENIQQTINDPTFWTYLSKIVAALEYPINLLTKFESDECRLDEVYRGFYDLLQYYKTNDSKLIATETLLEKVNNRWAFLNTEAHEFSFLLAPRNAHLFQKMPDDDYPRSIRGFKEYLKKYFEDPEKSAAAEKSFVNYLSHVTSDDVESDDYCIDPLDFWNIYGSKFNEIKPIALKILSIPVSSASSERIWSVYGRIHTKYRGALSNEKVEKLVYVRTNKKLMEPKPTNIFNDSDSE